MQNMQVILYPKQIHISTNASISIRLTYKKMAITTNHQLEKYQNRQSYQVKNNVAMINDQVKFKMSKQFEFHNTKIVIIVIGTKGREVSCLGDICLDLASIKQKKGKDNQLFKAKIQKCKDPKALLFFDIRFLQKPVDLNEMKRNKKQKMPELGILKTDHYYKEELYISRRQKIDKPTAYEISRKNYKNNQILRNNSNTISKQKQKRDSKDSAKQNTNNGSYKKRFLYEFQRNDKTSQKSSSSKSIRNNYLSVYQKDKSPSPRIKTPEPITLETLKSRQSHNRIKSKVQPLNLSEFDTKKVHFEDSNELIDLDTFRGNGVSNSRGNYSEHVRRHNKEMSDSNISESSLSSIKQQKDSKYKLITDKLELIESKIRKRSRSKEQHEDKPHNITKNGNHKISKSQIDEIGTYSIVNEYQVSRTLTIVSNPNNSRKDNQRHQKLNSQKNSLSPMSPTQSTCPQNQLAPSPIQVIQTPTINKSSLDEIKMSEFTINSKKNEIPSQIDIQKPHETDSQRPSPNPSPSPINPKSFNQINMEQNTQNQKSVDQKLHWNLACSKNRKDSKSPQSGGKKQITPSSLSFERRQTELKLQKKSSYGQNYLEIQVKMLELEIQDKNMKLQKLEKKLQQKQEQHQILSKQREQNRQKITNLSSQIIELKTKNLQFQRKIKDDEQLENKFKEKTRELGEGQQEIIRLRSQIAKISLSNEKKECKQCTEVRTQSEKEQQGFREQLKIYENSLSIKDQVANDLKSQLQTYQHQVQVLRERLNEAQITINKKFAELVKTNKSNLETISSLQQKIQVLQSEKKSSPNHNSSASESMDGSKSPKNQEKAVKNAQNNQLAQQVLEKTIQKQNLLQQSLKSLQIRNKSLSQQVQTLQKQKQQVSQKAAQTSNEMENRISKLQKEFQSLHIKLKQTEQNVLKSDKQKNQILEQIQKKEKTIQKLSSVNESLQQQLYEIQNQQPKNQDLDEPNELLLIKNAQNEQIINELKQKLNNKQKQVKILKNLLKQKQNESAKSSTQQKQQMRRQIPEQHQIPSKNDPWKNSQHSSKSQELLKIKVTEQGKQNFYDQYLNEKAKCVNLQAQLRFAQNQIRNHKMRIDLLVQEKNALEKQLENGAFGVDKMKQTTKTKYEQKVLTSQPANIQEPLRQNGHNNSQLLKQSSLVQAMKIQQRQGLQQIQRLKSQVSQLNSLLDQAILHSSQQHDTSQSQQYNKQNELIDNNSNLIISSPQHYMKMIKRMQIYEMQLREKKNKMAQIVNAIWRGGNASMIDEIDRIMSVE